MTDTRDTPDAAKIRKTGEPVVQPAPLTRSQRLMRQVQSPAHWRRALQLRVRWPRLFFVAVVVAIASLGLMFALLNSPLLEVNSVKVEGTDVLSTASVRQLAGLKGQHVMLADLDAAQERIASLPMVKEVTVSRDWPNGIKVVIVERTPWGRWRANNTVWAIDSEGVILEGPAPAWQGPIVTQVSALPPIKAGARVHTSAVHMASELHERGAPLALPSVVAYEWSLTDGLIVVTEHGRIIFGDADGLNYKYAIWDLLEQEAYRRGEPLLFADLRFGLRPRVEIGLNVGRDIRIQPHATANLSEQ